MTFLPWAVSPIEAPAQWMSNVTFLTISLWQWILLGCIAVGAYLVGAILQWLLLFVGEHVTSRTKTKWDNAVIKNLPGPARIVLAVLLARIALPLVGLRPGNVEGVEIALTIILILAIMWLALRLIGVGADLTEDYLTRGVEDDSLVRSMHTWVAVPRRIARFLMVLLALALICLQFEVIRSVGMSLLASAGVAGIALGIAAQNTLGNLFAGIQLVCAQPIKIGDVVIVEGEYGTIEEINLTHVVIRIWDLRRLIVPVSYFLEKPFQNWTREAPDLLGTVYLYTDYTVPIADIRQELDRVLEKNDDWDGKASGVVVTNMKEDCVEVRLLVSAKSSSTVWNLRCHVREKMLEWLQTKGIGHVPLERVKLENSSESA